jgi:hypothetical protein
MTNQLNPVVRAVRLGIADYSAERAIKHCEHAFVSISGKGIPGYVALASEMLQLPSMRGKIMHCTLHNYSGEGRTLDSVCTDFKARFCAQCKDLTARSSEWKYTDEWLDQENQRRAEFMSRFYEKRYEQK